VSYLPLPSSAADPAPGRVRHFIAAASLVMLASALYALLPYNRAPLETLYGVGAGSFTGSQFLVAATLAYLGSLALVSWTRPAGHPDSKSLRFWRVLLGFAQTPRKWLKPQLSPEDRLAVLTTLLKAYFAPMMVMSLMGFCVGAFVHATALVESGTGAARFTTLFDRHGYWFAMQAILLVDVLLFTLGYLVESRRAGNQIRSVDPTLLGWTAALLCYPPFNGITGAILGSQVSDFPQFEHPTTHLVMNLAVLALMAGYASASVALGLKASNLTHRGIVSRGPYALVRHPAYLCKNLAWCRRRLRSRGWPECRRSRR
jgi:protein-S-isoprenylcysteine O-methyltransferase Ste14